MALVSAVAGEAFAVKLMGRSVRPALMDGSAILTAWVGVHPVTAGNAPGLMEALGVNFGGLQLDGMASASVLGHIKTEASRGVVFERTYIGYAYALIPPGHLDMALAVAPYIVLARKALPGGDFHRLAGLTLSAWERETGLA